MLVIKELYLIELNDVTLLYFIHMNKGVFILAYFKFPGYLYRRYTPYIDTGASINICRKNCIPDEYWTSIKMKALGFNGSEATIEFVARNIEIEINHIKINIGDIYAFELEGKNMILGINFLRRYMPLTFGHDFLLLTLPCEKFTRKIRCIIKTNKFYTDEPWIKGDSNKRQEMKYKLHKLDLIKINPEVYYISNLEKINQKLELCYGDKPLMFWEKHKTKVKIELINPESIVKAKAIQLTEKDSEDMRINHIDELLKLELIEISNSKHSSPAFIVNNHGEIKRGKSRMVIDYRNLNEKTKNYPYPQPDRMICLKKIEGFNWFSKFDCKSGFHQLKLTDESKELTAFSTPFGFYQFTVLPFGYKNAPRRFQAFMDSIFKDYRDFILVYIDDILIFSKTKEEHINHLNTFAEIAFKTGLVLSKSKAEILKNQIEFLGQIIDVSGIKIQKFIISKLIDFDEEIDTKTKIKSFLGLVNQLRNYIPNLSDDLIPLYEKTKKDMEFTWTEKDKERLNKLKRKIQRIGEIKLEFPNEDLPFKWIVKTDASLTGFGAILSFKQNNKEKITKFASGKWKSNEANWEINKKELKAVLNGIKAFEHYIYNTNFILRTDNTQVKHWLTSNLNKKNHESVVFRQLARMIIDIKLFNFTVEVISSNDNAIADRLSREE